MSPDAVDFECIHGLSAFDKHYVRQPKDFAQFTQSIPRLSSIPDQLHRKSINYSFPRETLVSAIRQQYERNGCLNSAIEELIAKLKSPNTFTIITAHQPSLLTGPLYFVHKILSAIVTAQAIESEWPDKQIIPIFIIGGEDHDFEEMNNLHYKNDRYEWSAVETGGAVGRMSTEKIVNVIDELAPLLSQTFYGDEILRLLQSSFDGERTVGDAMQYFLARLFRAEPLLVVQMDDSVFKKAFVPHIIDEILHERSRSPVEETQKELQSIGYDDQALARDINFFYLHDGQRRRIIRMDSTFEVLDSEIEFSPKEMKQHIEQFPGRFSPNVIMRPIYQEFIFPNLAYIGGGGELAYWIERKSQFEDFNLTFPLLIRRHSAVIISEKNWKKMQDFPLDLCQWLGQIHDLENNWLDLDFSKSLDLSSAYEHIHTAFDNLRARMREIDESLLYANEAARVDALKPIDRLEKKMRRAIKKKESIQRRQLREIYSEFYPQGKLQERYLNFLQFYERRGPQLFEDLKKAFKPFKPEMAVVTCP